VGRYLVFWVAWISGPGGRDAAAFGVLLFLALREFITLVHTRRGDHRSLILAFFVVLPLQYVLVGTAALRPLHGLRSRSTCSWRSRWSALAGDPQRFLERNAKIQWGIMVCVYGLSHAPALLLLDLPRFAGRGAFLLFFLVAVVSAAQMVQETGQPLDASAPGGAAHRPFVLLPRLGLRCAGCRPRRRTAVLDHAVQAARRRPWASSPAAAAPWATW
jgi:hypothetical protein